VVFETPTAYSDCACIGPNQDDAEYRTIKGVLFGRLKEDKQGK